jgi:outer membrane protein OmpA-like peptidoglycan-associated protein
MAKKVYINEEQLALIVNYIKEGKEPLVITEENILEEGFKDWAIAGLMTLASVGGVQAQEVDTLTKDHIKAAEAVQNKLNSGDLDGDGVKDLKQYFKQADIALNQVNLEKLMNADIGSELQTYDTKSASTVKAKERSGYVVSDIKVDKDTIWKNVSEPATIDSTLDIKFDGNVFATADYQLNEDVKSELNYLIKKIEAMNGTIKSINIESSTDRESIKMGNEKLAQLRGEAVESYIGNLLASDSLKVKEYLDSLGIDVNITTLPEQGPDVYSKDMSQEDREQARKDTEQFRYVTINIDFEVKPAGEEDKKVSHIINRVTYEMIRVKPEYKASKVRLKRKSGGTTTKKFKCKVNKVKGSPIDCFDFSK